MKKVVVIHTSTVSLEDLKSLFSEIIPQVEMINIIDDSLLKEVMANGKISPGIVKRICTYAIQAECMGADLILNQCSSVGEVVNIARKMINIPYIKIDEQMAENAVNISNKISLIATVKSTVDPSTNLIKETAKRLGKEVSINKCVCDGALDILMKEKNIEKYNRIVIENIERQARGSDVIVLAQGSMINLLPHLDNIKVPVLTSPRSGVERVARMLNLL